MKRNKQSEVLAALADLIDAVRDLRKTIAAVREHLPPNHPEVPK